MTPLGLLILGVGMILLYAAWRNESPVQLVTSKLGG